jgi:tRNA A-37 threonylcarbamoyl transferase component Bud32
MITGNTAARLEPVDARGRIGRYQLLERLGRGASAEVYRARDTRLQREVAIKVFHSELVQKPAIRRKFVKEAQIHACLEHPSIVRIYDLLERDERTYLVMHYLPGRTLADLAGTRGGKLPLAAMVTYLVHVLEGIGFAHSRGVLHQDLKPQNIIVTVAHQAVVVDFGIAALLEDVDQKRRREVSGSPAYMAPEQARGRYLDARADIYSVAMTAYQIVTGHHPFEDSETIEEMLRCQIARQPAPPSSFASELPEELDEVLLKALAKEPEERYRSCDDFIEALGPVGGSLPGRSAGDQRDLRWDPRVDIALAARVTYPDGQVAADLRTINLSAGGFALLMHRVPPAGTVLDVEIWVPGEPEPLRSKVEVVATMPMPDGARVGCRFLSISDRDRRRARELVRDCLMLGGPVLEVDHPSAAVSAEGLVLDKTTREGT